MVWICFEYFVSGVLKRALRRKCYRINHDSWAMNCTLIDTAWHRVRKIILQIAVYTVCVLVQRQFCYTYIV